MKTQIILVLTFYVGISLGDQFPWKNTQLTEVIDLKYHLNEIGKDKISIEDFIAARPPKSNQPYKIYIVLTEGNGKVLKNYNRVIKLQNNQYVIEPKIKDLHFIDQQFRIVYHYQLPLDE